MKLIHSIPLFCLAVSANTFAEDSTKNGFYVLGEVTHSSTPLDKKGFDQSLTNASATGLTSNSKDQSNQWRLQGGYKFNPNFAVEGGYIDLGKSKYKAAYNQGTAQGELKAGGFDLAALGILPITDKVSIFAKLGVMAASVDSKLKTNSASVLINKKGSEHEFLPMVGVGASYKLTDNVDLRADFDRVSNIGKSSKTGQMDSNMLSIGAAYNF